MKDPIIGVQLSKVAVANTAAAFDGVPPGRAAVSESAAPPSPATAKSDGSSVPGLGLYEFKDMACTLYDRVERRGKGIRYGKATIITIVESVASVKGHYIINDAAMLTDAEYNALLSLVEPSLHS